MKFFSNYKIIFYSINISLIILYLFPGSIFGCIFLDDCSIQPQITTKTPNKLPNKSDH